MSMDYEYSHSERLTQHAREFVSLFAGHPSVSGVLLGGSPAHGGVDADSDIDLLVVVDALPTAARRADWLTRITGRAVEPSSLAATTEKKWDEFHTPGPKLYPDQWRGGVGGGLFYFTQGQVNRDMERVAELLTGFIGRDELERPSHIEEYLADLAHGIVLHDPNGFLADCQRRLAEYPESARTRLINYHWRRVEIAINEDLQRALSRDDLVHAYDWRIEGARHLIRMLFAMNRRYFRKAKSLHRLFPRFDVCPSRTWDRLVDGLRDPDPMSGAATLMTLAGEIIRLIDPPEVLERRDHWLWVCCEWTKNYGTPKPTGRGATEDGTPHR